KAATYKVARALRSNCSFRLYRLASRTAATRRNSPGRLPTLVHKTSHSLHGRRTCFRQAATQIQNVAQSCRMEDHFENHPNGCLESNPAEAHPGNSPGQHI